MDAYERYEDIAYESQRSGDIITALEYYQKCRDVLQNMHDHKCSIVMATVYNNIGSCYSDLKNYDLAIENYQLGMKIFMSLEDTSCNRTNMANTFQNIAVAYQKLFKFEEALTYFNKALSIQEKEAALTLEIAGTYHNMSSLYLDLSNEDLAIEYSQKEIDLLESHFPQDSSMASCYNLAGLIRLRADEIGGAVKFFNKALNKVLRKYPGHPIVVSIYHNLSAAFSKNEQYHDAITTIFDAIKVTKRYRPNDNDTLATLYNGLGNTYDEMGNTTTALKYLNDALELYEKSGVENITPALIYTNIGSIHVKHGDYEQSMEYFNKSLDIKSKLVPNSKSHALSLSNLATVYLLKNAHLDVALDLLLKAFEMYTHNCSPNHPEILLTGDYVCKTAYTLKNFDKTIEFADILIGRDVNFVYAYVSKAMALQQLGKYDEALIWYDKALTLHPGYADAKVHKIELISIMTKLEHADENMAKSLLAFALKEISDAQHMEAGDFEDTYKKTLAQRLDPTDEKRTVTLPTLEYITGGSKFHLRLEELAQEIYSTKEKFIVLEHKVKAVESKVDSLTQRIDILDKRVCTLSDAIGILRSVTTDINNEIDALSKDIASNSASIDKAVLDSEKQQAKLRTLLSERDALKDYEKKLREFYKQPDLRHYYQALLSELEASYIAAQAVASNEVSRDGSDEYAKAAGYLGMVASLIPIVGVITSKLISGIGSLGDVYQNAVDANSLNRIRSIAPSITDFDHIAMLVSIELTQLKKEEIIGLNTEIIRVDWKDYLEGFLKSSIKGFSEDMSELDGAIDLDKGLLVSTNGLESLISSYLTENNTKSKLLGRKDGLKVIEYLQEEAVAENIYFEAESLLESKDGSTLTMNSAIASCILTEIKPRMELRSTCASSTANGSNAKPKSSGTPSSTKSPATSTEAKKERKRCVVS